AFPAVPSSAASLPASASLPPAALGPGFSIAEEATWLRELGLEVYALPGTAASLQQVPGVREVRVEDGSAEQALRSGRIDVVFSASGGAGGSRVSSNASQASASLALERLAIDLGIPVVGEAALSRAVIQALVSTPLEALQVKSWRHYLSRNR